MAAVGAHRELVLTRQEGGEGLDWEEEPVPPPWPLCEPRCPKRGGREQCPLRAGTRSCSCSRSPRGARQRGRSVCRGSVTATGSARTRGAQVARGVTAVSGGAG